jgi:enterochelin esterase-like enzyme
LRPSLLHLGVCLTLCLSACAAVGGAEGTLDVETETPVIATSLPSATVLPPTPTNSPTPTRLSCWGEGGTLVPGEIESDLVKSPFAFLVYLPPCYAQEAKRSYPVLYLIHGQSFNQDQWDRLGADEVSDTLIAAGEISPFIIVMPQVIDWVEPPDVKFGQAVVEELIPYIDATYRTIPDRTHRAVGGLSRGASWALHLGLADWEMFGTMGAHSLPVFRNDAPLLRGWVEAIPKGSFPRTYIDLADRDLKDIRRSTEWFINLLDEEELPYQFFVFPGTHTEDYWGAHVEEYIRFYTAEW